MMEQRAETIPESQLALYCLSLHESPCAALTHRYGSYSYFSNSSSIMKRQKSDVTQTFNRSFPGKKIKTTQISNRGLG